MRRKGRPKKQKSGKNVTRRPGRPGRPRKRANHFDEEAPKPSVSRKTQREREREPEEVLAPKKEKGVVSSTVLVVDDGMSEGLHVTTSQVHALGALVSCRECGESVRIGVRPTTKGMISEFTVACNVCEDTKSTNTPNLVRERKRKREKKDAVLQKTENINYAHVASFLDNGLGYSGLRHYCKYFNARCLNEATFIVYARQVISDVVGDTEESLQYSASIVREVFKSQLETDGLVDLTVAFTTTYHQWGSDFCLVAGAVIELTTGLVLDYDVANMYCHVCKINAKKIVSMSPAEMTEWFNKHQDTCEIREWCDELDHDAEEGVREIEPKYLECFIAKKIWSRSIDKFGFRYTTLIHESDEKIHEELSRACVYGDVPILIDSATSCFSRRKSEHARTSFQTKLKAKCPRERVQTKDRIMYVYSMSIPEYNKFAISSNIKLRQLVKEMEGGDTEEVPAIMEGEEGEEQMPNTLELHEVKAIKRLVANGEEEEEEEEGEEERVEREILFVEEEVNREEQDVDDPEELEEEEGMEQDDEELLEEEEALAAQNAEEEERRKLEAEWGEEEEEEEEEEAMQQLTEEGDVERQLEEMHMPIRVKEESKSHFKVEKSPVKEEVLGLAHQLEEEEEEGEEQLQEEGDEEVEQLEENEEEEEVEEEEEEEEDDEEKLEQLRLEDEEDEPMEEDKEEEEEELQVEEQIQEEEEEEEETEAPPPPPQPTSKPIKKPDDDKTKTADKSKVVPANQRSQTGELRPTRKGEIKKNQQEEISKKRKQEDMEEEEQDVVVKRSKQEEVKQNSKEASKQGETKQKESEKGQKDKEEEKQADSKEGKSKEQEDKAKVNDKQKQKEDKPKEKEQQKSDSQQAAKKEEKQKADTKPSEKKEDKQKTETKQTENKESKQKSDTKPSDKKDDKQKPDTKQSEKKEEKKVTEAKTQDKEETKEKEKESTKQKEEESKPRAEVKQKGDANQQEKAEASKQPSKRPGEGEGKAAETRSKVTSNATVTQ